MHDDAMTSLSPSPARAPAAETAAGFDALFVLCGPAPRASELAALRRPPGLLPLNEHGLTAAQRIVDAAGPFLARSRAEDPVRLLIRESIGDDDSARSFPGRCVSDKDNFRGTGGVLRDAAADLDDTARILVVSATEVVVPSHAPILREVAAIDADVVVTRDRTHRPYGVWSVRAGCLRDVPAVGFVDFKEQVLPSLAGRVTASVATLGDSVERFHWIRDLAGYLACVADVREAEEKPRTLIVEGATVSPEATVVNSVVFQGAEIEPGAVVARSVIGRGVRVRRDQQVIDGVRSLKETRGERAPRRPAG